MIYRTLGQSGLKVSALTLGTMMFGEQTSTEDSLRIIDKPGAKALTLSIPPTSTPAGAPKRSSAKPLRVTARTG